MKDNSGQAFPSTEYMGMTLRDYFAGQALAGILANPDTSGKFSTLANEAYNYADAMLAERAKE